MGNGVIHDRQSWKPTEWGPVRWIVTVFTAGFIGWAGWVSNVLMDIQRDHSSYDSRITRIEDTRFTHEDGLAFREVLREHERQPGHAVIVERVTDLKEQLNRIERNQQKLLAERGAQ